MKVLLSGASGSGKTTLAIAVAQSLEIPFKNVPTIQIFQRFGIKNQDDLITKGYTQIELVENVYRELVKSRIQLIETEQHFISDRSPLDSIVYYQMQHAAFNTNSTVFIEELREMCSVVLKSAQILVIPENEKFLVENGLRKIDVNFAKKFTENLLFEYANFKNQHDIDFQFLSEIEENLDSRVALISKYLKGFLK